MVGNQGTTLAPMWKFTSRDPFVDSMGFLWLSCIEADLYLQNFIAMCSPLKNKTSGHGQFWPLVYPVLR